jgi:cysteine desulfurase
MSWAARLCTAERNEDTRRVAGLAAALVQGVLRTVDGSGTAVPVERRIGAICNLWFDGVVAEELLLVLDELGVCASAGSACASGALDPSHVLLAMGRSPAEARRHVRFSLGHSTTQEDVDRALVAIPEAVARLRSAT